jgi:hypothetical protein
MHVFGPMRFGICALARSRHVGGCALIWTRGRARVACACPSVRVRCARRRSAQLVAAVYIYLKRRHFNSSTTATSRRPNMDLGVPGARSFERCDTVSPRGTVVPPELGVPCGRSSRDLLVPPTTPQRSCLVSDASAQHGCCASAVTSKHATPCCARGASQRDGVAGSTTRPQAARRCRRMSGSMAVPQPAAAAARPSQRRAAAMPAQRGTWTWSSQWFVPCRAICRAVPCHAVLCRAVPCRAMPCQRRRAIDG